MGSYNLVNNNCINFAEALRFELLGGKGKNILENYLKMAESKLARSLTLFLGGIGIFTALLAVKAIKFHFDRRTKRELEESNERRLQQHQDQEPQQSKF